MNCEGKGGMLETDSMSVNGASVDIPVQTIPRPIIPGPIPAQSTQHLWLSFGYCKVKPSMMIALRGWRYHDSIRPD